MGSSTSAPAVLSVIATGLAAASVWRPQLGKLPAGRPSHFCASLSRLPEALAAAMPPLTRRCSLSRSPEVLALSDPPVTTSPARAWLSRRRCLAGQGPPQGGSDRRHVRQARVEDDLSAGPCPRGPAPSSPAPELPALRPCGSPHGQCVSRVGSLRPSTDRVRSWLARNQQKDQKFSNTKTEI